MNDHKIKISKIRKRDLTGRKLDDSKKIEQIKQKIGEIAGL